MFTFAGNQKNKGKVALDRAFCVTCFCVALAGPGLIVFGFMLLGVTNELDSNVELYNTAVDRWNTAGLATFTSARFLVNATCVSGRDASGSSRWAVLEQMTDPLTTRFNVRTTQRDMKSHRHFYYRSTSSLFRSHLYSNAEALNPTYRLDVAAQYLTPAARDSGFSLSVPMFRTNTTRTTSAQCATAMGRWKGTPKTWRAECVVVERVVALCLRVMLDYEYKWRLRTSASDGNGVGCYWGTRPGSTVRALQPALYAPLIEPSKSSSFDDVVLTLRSLDDPLLTAEVLSEGTLYFGRDVADQRVLGVLVVIIGVAFLAPCCVVVYVTTQGKKHKEHTKVLSAVEEREQGAARRGNRGGGRPPDDDDPEGSENGRGGSDGPSWSSRNVAELKAGGGGGGGGGRLGELRKGAGSKSGRYNDFGTNSSDYDEDDGGEAQGEEGGGGHSPASSSGSTSSRMSVSEVAGGGGAPKARQPLFCRPILPRFLALAQSMCLR